MTIKAIEITDWEVHYAFSDSQMKYAIPVIQGMVGDKKVMNEALLWLDLEKREAMTQDQIFKLGQPNERWMMMYLASGRSVDDLEIKATNH